MPETDGRPAPADPASVGHVVKPHGLNGELVIEPADSLSSQFEPGMSLWFQGRWREIQKSRAAGGRWVVAVEGVADRDAAEALRGVELTVEAEALPDLDGDRYYVHDLVGCALEDPDGTYLGEVVAITPGPRDWLEVENDGERSLMPMVQDWLKEVNLEERRIVIDPPAGLSEMTRA